jgi:phosphoglycerate dehydrogenase-like enzyme
MKPKVLFAVVDEFYPRLFLKNYLDRIATLCDVIEAEVPDTKEDKDFLLRHIAEADILISSWDTAKLDAEVIDAAPNLKLMTHAAGSIKPVISDAFFEKGVRATSSATAISYGVAEFCLGMMLLAPKRVFWTMQETRKGNWRDGLEYFNGPFEIYGQTIGIIGASHVGRYLIKLLQNFTCNILLYDPYCSAEQAAELGVTKAESLNEVFSTCRVVSLNAPHTPATEGMITAEHFRLLKDGSLFINTARGAIVNEEEMIEELKKERFIACLDVTEPEPPVADSPLRKLPNVILTPHEAGVVAENMARLGTFVADEIEAFVNNRPLHFEIKKEHLSTIG